VSVDDVLGTCGILSISELCDDCDGGKSGEKDEDGGKCDLEAVPSFTTVHISYETIVSLFFMCRFYDLDE
jgi:hypothetical protein